MKRIPFLFFIVILAMSLVVSCVMEEDDPIDDLRGRWKCERPTFDNAMDYHLVIAGDSFEIDIYDSGTTTPLRNKSTKGGLKVFTEAFVRTTTHHFDGAVWVADPNPVQLADYYVLNGNVLAITADWDGNPGTEVLTFIKG